MRHPFFHREQQGSADTEALQTDAMRFLAIVAICLFIVFMPIFREISIEGEKEGLLVQEGNIEEAKQAETAPQEVQPEPKEEIEPQEEIKPQVQEETVPEETEKTKEEVAGREEPEQAAPVHGEPERVTEVPEGVGGGIRIEFYRGTLQHLIRKGYAKVYVRAEDEKVFLLMWDGVRNRFALKPFLGRAGYDLATSFTTLPEDLQGPVKLMFPRIKNTSVKVNIGLPPTLAERLREVMTRGEPGLYQIMGDQTVVRKEW